MSPAEFGQHLASTAPPLTQAQADAAALILFAVPTERAA